MKFFRRKKREQRGTAPQHRGAKKEQRVFSYYTASHKQLNTVYRKNRAAASLEAAAKHGRYVRTHWFGILTFGVLFVSAIYLLSLTFSPHLTIEGTNYRSSVEYQRITADALKSNPFNLTKLTLQRASLEKKLKEQIPEAREVHVSASLLGRRPSVVITMDEPAAVMKQAGNQDLIVSQRGRLLLAANQSKSTTNLPVIENKSGVSGKAGEQYLRPSDMESLTSLFDQIKASGSAASFILLAQPREIIMLEPSRGVYQVKFMLGDTLLQQYGALRATQKKLHELNQTPSEYVDARLATKVFYK